jgi:RNA polymerase sigma factor (sigma-70 family)
MANAHLEIVVRHLRQLVGPPGAEAATDRQLLEQFTARQEEAAFALLLRRHGPMVMNVCRRVLGNLHDAEDVFQATFLVLARKARSIRKQESVGCWLHAVAYRLALKVRAQAARRRAQEFRPTPMTPTAPDFQAAWHELQAVLDEELARLPANYRAALVLCYLEGKTQEEAAHLFGCPLGTVRSRLARARALLRGRLARRGLALSGGSLAAVLAVNTAAATLPAGLSDATRAAAVRFAAGRDVAGLVSDHVLTLARGACKPMALTNFTLAAFFVVVLGIVGLGVATRPAAAQKTAPAKPQTASKEAPAPPAKQTKVSPSAKIPSADGKDRVTLTGRVFGADGRPLAGARLAAVAHAADPTALWKEMYLRLPKNLVGATKTDAQGKYRLTFVRPALRFTGVSRMSCINCHDSGMPRPPVIQEPAQLVHEPAHGGLAPRQWTVLVHAPGHGVAWQIMSARKRPAEIMFRLEREEPVRGRLVDLQGQPAAGVKMHLVDVLREAVKEKGSSTSGGSSTGTTGSSSGSSTGTSDSDAMTVSSAHESRGVRLYEPAAGVPFWPGPVTTDAQGRFVLRGVNRKQRITVHIRDERYALYDWQIPGGDAKKEITLALAPPRLVEGRVVYADTRKGVANLEVSSFPQGQTVTVRPLSVRTDAQGRFRMNHYAAASYELMTEMPAGQPYFPVSQTRLTWPSGGQIKASTELVLPRGILAKGKVVEADSGKPVAGLQVTYIPVLLKNPFVKDASPFNWWVHHVAPAATDRDGNFQFAVLPGPGTVWVAGVGHDVVYHRRAMTKLFGNDQGGTMSGAAWIDLDLKPDAKLGPLVAKIRWAARVKGQVVGPDGKATSQARLVVLTDSEDPRHQVPLTVRAGQFELPGCDPTRSYRVLVVDADNHCGAVAEVAGKPAPDKPLTIKLGPCGSAAVRVLNAAGRPVPKYQPVVTPAVGGVPATDKEGRCTVPDLVPGVKYALALPGGKRKEFQVEAGKVVDLGVMVIAPASEKK